MVEAWTLVHQQKAGSTEDSVIHGFAPPCPQGTLGSLRRKESELSQVADCSGMAPFDSSPVDKTQLASEEGIISYLGMFDFTPHLPQAEGKQALKSGTGHISLDCSRT